MKSIYSGIFFIIWSINTSNSSIFESDSCYSFGSGNVFPGGARKIDHKLQFTKAMSTYFEFQSI